VLPDDRDLVVTQERWPSSDHLVEHAAQRVKICSGRYLSAHRLLRWHVAHGPDHETFSRETRLVEGERKTEVADFRLATFGQPHISWL
jgi:hypothetical protein